MGQVKYIYFKYSMATCNEWPCALSFFLLNEATVPPHIGSHTVHEVHIKYSYLQNTGTSIVTVNETKSDLLRAASVPLNASITASEKGLVIKDTEGRSKQFRNIFLGLLKMRYTFTLYLPT